MVVYNLKHLKINISIDKIDAKSLHHADIYHINPLYIIIEQHLYCLHDEPITAYYLEIFSSQFSRYFEASKSPRYFMHSGDRNKLNHPTMLYCVTRMVSVNNVTRYILYHQYCEK